MKIIQKILTLDENQEVIDGILSTKENKQEILMYCFNNNIKIQDGKIENYTFFKNFKITDLTFFANNTNYNNGAELFDEYTLEQLHRYEVILNDKWKEGASDIAKINYILNFTNEISHRDVKYSVAPFNETF